MSLASPPGLGKARLNPFAFPSDTSFRFGLLLVFLFSGTITFAEQIWSSMHSEQRQAYDSCVKAVLADLAQRFPTQVSSQADAEHVRELGLQLIPRLASCSSMLRPESTWIMVAILITIAVTLVGYSLHPFIKCLRQRLETVPSEDIPHLATELQHLCWQAQLKRPPRFVWNPLSADQPLAFGCWGRNYVGLSAGFVTQFFFHDLPSFRAIVLHELAHIRNGDVAKTYLTIAVGFAFFSTSVLPAVLAVALSDVQLTDSIELLINLALWTVIILLSGLAVLRTREYYADLRASAENSTAYVLNRVLDRTGRGARATWRRYFAFHPAAAERQRVLAEPAILFRLGLWDAFGVGIATWSVIDSLKSLATPYLPGSERGVLLFNAALETVLPGVVSVLALGALGIAIWRAAFAALVAGTDPYHGTGRMAVATASGYLLLVGLKFLNGRVGSILDPTLPAASLALTAKINTYFGLLMIPASFLIFRWLPAAASAWFPVVVRSRSPGPAVAASVGVAVLLLTGTVGASSFVTTMLGLAPSFLGQPYVFAQVGGAPVLFAAMVAVGFPFAATLWRRSRLPAAVADWVFLERRSVELPKQEPLQLGRVVTTGLAAGLLFCALMEVIYFRKHLPDGVSRGVGFAFQALSRWANSRFGPFGFELSGLAVIAQALAAGVASARSSWLGPLCGMFAYLIAAFVISTFMFFFFSLPLSYGFVFLMVAAMGALAVLPVSVAVTYARTILRNWIQLRAAWANEPSRRSSSPSGPQNAVTPRFRVRASGIGIGVLFVAVIAGITVSLEETAALRSLQLAAANGDAAAQNRLGISYSSGKTGVGRDDGQAVMWFRKAAEQGDADAQIHLAEMYRDGRGVSRDDSEALRWVMKAAEQGNAAAENALGWMLHFGRGTTKDDVAAAQRFQSAATKGHAAAETNLARMYLLGQGVSQDDQAAVALLRQAAQQRWAEAQVLLGSLCAQGRGTPQDDQEAVMWFREAAGQGHPGAQFNLGEMYEAGRALPRDDEQALLWIRKAADGGLEDAQRRLREMCVGGLKSACLEDK